MKNQIYFLLFSAFAAMAGRISWKSNARSIKRIILFPYEIYTWWVSILVLYGTRPTGIPIGRVLLIAVG